MDQPSERANADLREPPRDGGPREAAFDIKSAIAELSGMARIHRLEMLGYLLDMAHLDAEEALRRGNRSPI